MNSKLYKYLPFGIEVQYENAVKNLNFKGNFLSGKGVLTGINFADNYISINSNLTAKDFSVKPILHPFEGITKELPLTKAAAEIAGMKEGEIVIPFYEFCKILIDYDFNGEDSKFKLETDVFHQKAANIYVNSYYTWLRIELFNPHLIGYSTLELKQNPEIVYGTPNPVRRRIYVEKAFDFIRAMHFAVDFKDGEFIPKT